MYDDDVFVDRFRLQLAMFEIAILIGLSRRLPAHIEYEILISKSLLATGMVWGTISFAGM